MLLNNKNGNFEFIKQNPKLAQGPKIVIFLDQALDKRNTKKNIWFAPLAIKNQ